MFEEDVSKGCFLNFVFEAPCVFWPQYCIGMYSENWRFYFGGRVDELFKSRQSQRDVFGRIPGLVEGIQSHLRSRFAHRLRCNRTDHFTGSNDRFVPFFSQDIDYRL